MSKENFVCKNCGECCGPVLITREERNAIRIFLLKHPEIAEYAKSKEFSLHCVFRDNEKKRCLIYDVRPSICKLYTCESNSWKEKIPASSYSSMRKFGIAFINERFGNPDFREKFQQEHNHHFPELIEMRRK